MNISLPKSIYGCVVAGHGLWTGIDSMELTKRQRFILRQFQRGYTGWAPLKSPRAFLCAGEGVVGQPIGVRIETLEAMAEAGYLVETQTANPPNSPSSYRGDLYWNLAPEKNSENPQK